MMSLPSLCTGATSWLLKQVPSACWEDIFCNMIHMGETVQGPDLSQFQYWWLIGSKKAKIIGLVAFKPH